MREGMESIGGRYGEYKRKSMESIRRRVWRV